MSEYHWTHEHETTFIKCLSSAEKSYKIDLYSRIAELPQNKTIEVQTENIYLIRYHSLIRPFTNGELSVKKTIQLIRDEKLILSNSFTWRYRPSAKTAKWTKPKASRWTRLHLKEQHSSIIHRLHTKNKHTNDNIPESRRPCQTFHVNLFFVVWWASCVKSRLNSKFTLIIGN